MTVQTLIEKLNYRFRRREKFTLEQIESDHVEWSEVITGFSPAVVERACERVCAQKTYMPAPHEFRLILREICPADRKSFTDYMREKQSQYEANKPHPAVKAFFVWMCDALTSDNEAVRETARRGKESMSRYTKANQESKIEGHGAIPVPAWLLKWYSELSDEERSEYAKGCVPATINKSNRTEAAND